MLQGIDLNQRIEYVSKEDKGEPKTVFVFKPLSGSAMLDLSKMVVDGKITLSGDYVIDFLSKSISEINNFGNDGQTVKQKLEALPMTVLIELMEETNRINQLGEEEQKN